MLLYKELFWLDKVQHMLKLYRGAMLIFTLFSVCQIERDEIFREYFIFRHRKRFLGAEDKEQKIIF